MNTHRWLAGIENLFSNQRRRKQTTRHQAVIATESLETKVLLAADTLGLIQGTVFNDVSDNGLTGEDPTLAAATVRLYRDGGNFVFDNGGADDTFVDEITTIAGGEFSFANLGEGRYFVRQLALAGYMQHTGEDVVTVDISAADALGTPGTLIDDFTIPAVPGQGLAVNAAGTATDSSAATSASTIGGERDISVTATLGSITFEANGAAFPSHLNYNANFGATGNARVVWDGADGDATMLNPSGLVGEDLTAADAAGFLFNIGTSQPVTIELVVHSGPLNSSTATIALVASAIDTLYVPYSTFMTSTGTGADFANVGAIELSIDAPVATTTTVTDLLRTQAPTKFTTNFANFIPMTLGNLVFDDSNNNGVFDSGTDTGLDDVAITLFEDTNKNNEFDSGIDQSLDTTTTAGGGLYSFSNLFPGDYIVRIDPGNFAASGPLEGFESFSGSVLAPDADVLTTNNDNNGYSLAGAVVSLAVTLTNGMELSDDGDADSNTNLSLDFAMLGAADIIITKTDNVTSGLGYVIAGSGDGNLIYTITATNGGSGNATGVTVSDTGVLSANLPAGVTFVSAVGSGGSSFNTTTGVWDIGNLASGDSETLTVTMTVGATASDTLVISNTASLASINEVEIDAVPGNDTSTITTNVDRNVDIVVTKVVNQSTVTAGSSAGNLVFTVTARNLGPSNASGVNVSDLLAASLPAGVTFVSGVGSGGSTYNSTTGVWTIGNLDTGASATLAITLTAAAPTANGTVIPNTASLGNVSEFDTNDQNNIAQASATIERDVDIVITKLASVSTVIAGSGPENLSYTITARNNGPSDASGVSVTDVGIFAAISLPGMSVVSATPSGSSTFDLSSGLWTIGNLTSGDTQTLVVTLTVGAAATNGMTIKNTATLTAINEIDRDANNNTQTATVNVVRNVDIAVTKSAVPVSPTPVIAGSGAGNLVYTVTATNNGPSNASGVSVRDNNLLPANLPVGVTFVSAVDDGGATYNSATGIWTINNLATAATRTLTVTLTVGATAVPQTYDNTVALETLNEIDRVTSNNTAAASTVFQRSVDIEVRKTATSGPIIASSGAGNLIYTVTAQNKGPSNASGVTVSDIGVLTANLPAGVTFVSATGSGSSTFSASTGLWTIGNLATNETAIL